MAVTVFISRMWCCAVTPDLILAHMPSFIRPSECSMLSLHVATDRRVVSRHVAIWYRHFRCELFQQFASDSQSISFANPTHSPQVHRPTRTKTISVETHGPKYRLLARWQRRGLACHRLLHAASNWILYTSTVRSARVKSGASDFHIPRFSTLEFV